MSEDADPLAEVGNKVGAGITTAMMGARMAVEVARRMRSDAITEWAATDSEDWKERVRTFNPELVDAYDKGIAEGMDQAGARRYAADVVTTNAAVRSAQSTRASTAGDESRDPKPGDERNLSRADVFSDGAEQADRVRASEQHAHLARKAESRHAEAYRKARNRGLPDAQARKVAAKAWHQTWNKPSHPTTGSQQASPGGRGHYAARRRTSTPKPAPPTNAPKHPGPR